MTAPTLQQLSSSQASPEVPINENANALAPAAAFGRKATITTGLTWGYYGGSILVNGLPTNVADGTVTLTGSTTNYVSISQAGSVSVATSRNAANAPLYSIVTGSSSVTSYVDERGPDLIARLTPGAISQAVTSANVTLTQTQALAAQIVVTGTLTAQRDVIVPLVRRSWSFYHNGASFPFRVIGASGTGVVINIGQRAIVECDGTNCYFPNPMAAQIVSDSTARAIVLEDADQRILLHPSADTTARTWTIPANGSVAFPVGSRLRFVNQNAAGVLTIAITTDTMRLAGAGTTGSRTLAANGVAEAIKVTSTEWIISGTGLT